ncbi:MAG: hypothetical protein ACTSUO_06050 [Candidatus Thorarchaeota archaeon]
MDVVFFMEQTTGKLLDIRRDIEDDFWACLCIWIIFFLGMIVSILEITESNVVFVFFVFLGVSQAFLLFWAGVSYTKIDAIDDIIRMRAIGGGTDGDND